jgi:hydrogenase expression/formation protein HypD
MAVWQARQRGLTNFSMLVSHVLVPPAMESILASPDNRVQAFLGPGHVCTVVGLEDYRRLVDRYRVPIVITGFEPVDLLDGVLRAVRQLEDGRAELENAYPRAVRPEGNTVARQRVAEVFERCDRTWRGMGLVPDSGYRLRGPYRAYDAAERFDLPVVVAVEPSGCISHLVLRGQRKPSDCPAFGRECTPESPLGATMVSAEGACAAYHASGRVMGGGGLA